MTFWPSTLPPDPLFDTTQDQRLATADETKPADGIASPLHPLVMQEIMEQVMSYIDERMAMIFNEWARRYSETPNEFSEILDSNGKPIEDYGRRCAAYFKKMADEMDAAGVLPVAPPPSA